MNDGSINKNLLNALGDLDIAIAERDAAITRAERAESAHAEAVELLEMVYKEWDVCSYGSPTIVTMERIEEYIKQHKEAGK